MKNPIVKTRIIVLFLIFILAANAALAFTTNGTGKTFEFAVTSAKNNEIASGSTKTYIIVGDVTATVNSSTFKTEIGFLRTTGYLSGESCQTNIECAGGFCCSNACQSTACSVSQPAAASSSGSTSTGGGGSLPPPEEQAGNTYTRVFSVIGANEEKSFVVPSENLDVTKVTF